MTEALLCKQAMLQDNDLLNTVEKAVEVTTIALKADKRVFFCGNGGSAADAQHLASELSGRFLMDRDPLFAEALHTNSSALTAIANDYGYDEVYARMVKAKGRQGDILYALSTSGNSMNVIKAIDQAKSQFMVVIGLTGMQGGKMKHRCDYLLRVPSLDTPRIQEGHILMGHIICDLVEKGVFG